MSLQLVLKFLLSASVIVGAAELAKRNVSLGALLCALPLTSLLVMIWTWVDTGDQAKVVALNWSILAYTIPSFALFLVFPALLRTGLGFWPALLLACLVTGGVYRLCQPWLDRAGA
jgi:ABC-type proline/glycine betaine transport system permease subunit